MDSTRSHAQAVIDFGQELEKLRVPDPALCWHEGPHEVFETIADRGFRAMHIAYILAFRCNSTLPERAASLLLYPRLDVLLESKPRDAIETHEALVARLEPLGKAADFVLGLYDEFYGEGTLEAHVAMDSYLLAEAFSLLEQSARGRSGVDVRLQEISRALSSHEARAVLAEASEVSPFRYWRSFSEAAPYSPSEVDYVYEVGKLRLVSRSGWEYLGIRHESVGAHSYRGAQLTPFLAQACAEYDSITVDPCAVAMHVAVHDVPEARGGDANRVAKAYVLIREDEAIHHQTVYHGAAGERIKEMWTAVETKSSLEGRVAKDGDYTEMVIEARSLVQRGISAARDWISNTKPHLTTPLGRQIIQLLHEETDLS